MRLAKIIKNDVVNGQGVCVSVWTQGCPHRCKGCFNPETWEINGGYKIDEDKAIAEIMEAITANGVSRNLSILGGEPLAPNNLEFTLKLLRTAKEKYPNIKTFVWTGYTYENLSPNILGDIDILIDGQFILEERDITLPLRGSKNQRILDIKEIKKNGKE